MYRQQRSRFHMAAECLSMTSKMTSLSQNLFGRGSKYLIKCMNSFIPFRRAFQLYQEYRALFGTDNGVFRNICNKIGERNTLIKCACWLNFMFDKNFILRQLWKCFCLTFSLASQSRFWFKLNTFKSPSLSFWIVMFHAFISIFNFFIFFHAWKSLFSLVGTFANFIFSAAISISSSFMVLFLYNFEIANLRIFCR